MLTAPQRKIERANRSEWHVNRWWSDKSHKLFSVEQKYHAFSKVNQFRSTTFLHFASCKSLISSEVQSWLAFKLKRFSSLRFEDLCIFGSHTICSVAKSYSGFQNFLCGTSWSVYCTQTPCTCTMRRSKISQPACWPDSRSPLIALSTVATAPCLLCPGAVINMWWAR